MKELKELTRTVIYTPQIPQGEARTRGWGVTRRVMILRVGENFRTLNSPHEVLRDLGTCRTDYGMQRGHARRLLDRAAELLPQFSPAGERSTCGEL